MTNLDIAHQRLHNQHVAGTRLTTAADLVRWFGAVQAQEYVFSLWALGLRLPGTVEADIEQAVADRTIVRTWPMRGTLHFVAPEDARWMLKLLTPRVISRLTGMYRRVELDETVFAQSRDVIINALQGGKQLTRKAVYKVLEAAGISTAKQRGMHITGHLAQKGLICFGPREGKQQTVVLLDEWVPPARELARDEALAEVARRYFISHGPATVQDFAWWSGLVAADANAALEMVKSELIQEDSDGRTYWLSSSLPSATIPSSKAFLLPPFDEYTVAYKDRTAAHPFANTSETAYAIDANIVMGGKIIGRWKRTFKKDTVFVEPLPFAPMTAAERQAFTAVAYEYGRFLGMDVEFS